MKKYLTAILVIIIPLIISTAYHYNEIDSTKKREITQELVIMTLKHGHYKDLKINDEFSKVIFKEYIDNLGFNKKFLLQKDIDLLKDWETKIDDEILFSKTSFFNLSSEIIEKRVKEAEEYYKEILEKPFDFTKDESIELDDEKTKYAKTKDELKDAWRKALKYQVMLDLNSSLKIQEKAKEENDTTIEQKSFEELEKKARDNVRKRNKEWFERMKKLKIKDRHNVFLNTIASYYDPHTGYYPPKDKEDFDISMSGQLEGIGATLSGKDNYVTVVQIIPGSPSWKQGELEKGDKIIKVAQENEEPVNIIGWRLDEAVQLIRGEKGTKVILTIQKVDGTIKTIEIVRDVVVIEATYAKSAVVHNENSDNYGYIYLPKFYANFKERNGGRRAADDVLKEIEKLKKEKVKGIVIDLRNNGGGSLEDAVEMAGFFIKKGPIVQVKDSRGNITLRSDTDPRVQYDGPLVVMVNNSSASASEIFAAAMQDYNRAVIVGSQKTFGKGTVQSFFNLDGYVQDKLENYKPFGAIKLTFQKFYRVNGGSTQLKGVTPDIIMPDKYQKISFGEGDLDYHLKWDEIKSADYITVNNSSEYTDVIKKSDKRIKKNKKFKLVIDQAEDIKYYRDISAMPLNLEDYKKYSEKLEETNNKYKDLFSDTTVVMVDPLVEDQKDFKTDTVKMATFKKWEKQIKKDFYISESINVLEDISDNK